MWRDVEEAAAACVAVRGTVEPVAEWGGVYAEGLERYRELYPALRAPG
jgi:hypothetical protein